MKLVNDDYTDLSKEGYLVLTAILTKVWSAETLAYKMSDILDALHAKGNLVQTKKMHLNKARRAFEQALKELEVAFDSTFDRAFTLVSGEEMGRTAAVQRLSNFETTLVLSAFSREGDGDDDKMRSMLKAIQNFRPNPDVDIDGLLRSLRLQ